MKSIVVVATGGTIAGVAESSTQTSGYAAGALKVEALLAALPDLSAYARVGGEQLYAIDSKDVTAAHWLRLARRLRELVADPVVDGVVVTHGTDTLEETAYFLNLTLPTHKPVVLVGSMRPATALSADGPMNLYAAIRLAAADDANGKGVLVVMNDQIGAARDVAKLHTTNVATFRAGDIGFLGSIENGQPAFYRAPTRAHTLASEFGLDGVLDGLDTLPIVDIIYGHADLRPCLIEASLANGAAGLVYAGTGNGTLHAAVEPVLREAAARGAVVVRSSRVGGGVVVRNGDVDDDVLGYVTADNLNPQKARVLLQLALLKTRDPRAIQLMFNRY